METIVLNGTGPSIRLKAEGDKPQSKVDVVDGKSIKTVPITDNTKLKFAS